MHRELLDALSVITEEEQRILDEQRGIDPQLYTEKKELIVDSEKLLKKGKLIQVRPQTRLVNFPKHKHNYVKVIYMCQGTTTHILNGSKVILEAGDLLFLNQNAEQEILPAGELKVQTLSQGFAWLDTGTHDSLAEASIFVEVIEKRQGLKIACLEDIAFRQGWITAEKMRELAQPMAKNTYGQ